MFEVADLGKFVVGPSHRVLGTLSQVDEDCFRVTTNTGEIWLDNQVVWSVDQEITMICEPRDVRRYLCPEPPGARVAV